MATNFSIPYVFVIKTGNTMPSTGVHSSTLTVDQFGVFGANQAAIVAGTSAAAPYLQLFQGTTGVVPGPNKRSDRIYASNIVEWYKVPARTTAAQQVTTISGLLVHEGEEVSVAFRVHSKLIENAFANGMLKSILVQAPCLDCGSDPCAELTSDQYDTFYTSIATKINAHTELLKFMVAAKTGTGNASVVTITGLAQANPFPNNANDPFQNPFAFDRLWFNTYVGKNPDISQDFMWVDDRCDLPFNTVTSGYGVNTTARATYASGSAAEVRLDMANHYSYQVPTNKELFSDADYNMFHRTGLIDATFYDLYYVKYYTEEKAANDQTIRLLESAKIYIPNGGSIPAAFEALVVPNWGAVGTKIASGTINFSPLTP